MLKRKFDWHKRLLCVVYLRMSSRSQNERSPDQQLDEIRKRLKQLNLPWVVVKVYRDNAKSGRYIRKRPGFRRMLRDIKIGLVKADLILVDTLERFGRIEELETIRRDLHRESGVLVLTADKNFADPTTPEGKVMASFEAVRAQEDGRVKAHNVFRGKRDAAQLGHWPGGPAPFGLKLKSIMKEVKGRLEVDYCVLEDNPDTDWIMRRILLHAEKTGWGGTRLAKHFNKDLEIPGRYRHFSGATIDYWLQNPIYGGDLRWAEFSTDVICDARVIERNPEEEIIFVRDFCKGLVSRNIMDNIRTVRNARSYKAKKDGDDKLIKPLAPGLALTYLLSGLVRCGHCKRAMRASASGVYATADGTEKRYVGYVCPGYLDGRCENSTRVPEEWLRGVVLGRIRELLFTP
jgi:DNA invertase Pin-like site-specific DNA recombinase